MKPASQRRRLLGLDPLGERLRQLREKAGLSQMNLAGKMGFNPTHGYKYILRLEKGQVPNPTLRTLVGYIEACGATWADVADVLPRSGPPGIGPAAVAAAKRKARPDASRPPKPSAAPSKRPPADPRPLRVRLRSELIARRSERADYYWQEVTRAEQEVTRMLQTRRVLSSAHHDYVAFVRPCCSVLQAFADARPQVIDRELARLVERTAAQGLDEGILGLVKDICLRHLRQEAGPEA